MTRELNIIAIEDDADHAELLRRCLNRLEGYAIRFTVASSVSEGRDLLKDDKYDVIFLDYRLGPVSGLDLLLELRAAGDERPVITLTGMGDVYVAVEMIRAGADEYISKDDLSAEFVGKALGNALDKLERIKATREQRGEIERRLTSLTPREREVMDLIIDGLTTRQIAEKLFRSESTIKIHRSHLMQKMEANTPADLARMVLTLGDRAQDNTPGGATG